MAKFCSHSCWTTRRFLCLNFYNFSTFTNNVGHKWYIVYHFVHFGAESFFIYKDLQFWTILLCYKKCLTEKITSLLKVFLSLPLNYLPYYYKWASFHSFKVFFPPDYFPLGLKEAKSKNILLSFWSHLRKNKAQRDKLSKVEIMAEW